METSKPKVKTHPETNMYTKRENPLRLFKQLMTWDLKRKFKLWKPGGIVINFESGGTLGNLFLGAVGACPGEPQGAVYVAPPSDTE